MHPLNKYSFDNIISGLNENISQGLIQENFHKSYPNLRLYCYTRECQYSKSWNDFTVSARGLIIDVVDKFIVALPFPKFFNYGEHSETIPDTSYEVFEKLDGSLGIAYFYDNKWHVATKGSFHSEQAEWATKYFRTYEPKSLDPLTTYLFEIIYPENKIVVDYDKESFMCLIGAINTDSHVEEDIRIEYILSDFNSQYFRLPKIYESYGINDLIQKCKELSHNEEGFVVKWNNGLRLKFKSDAYCRIHKLVSNITPLGIWELMSSDSDQVNFTNTLKSKLDLPEEIQKDFDTIYNIFLKQRSEIFTRMLDCEYECVLNSVDLSDIKGIASFITSRYDKFTQDLLFCLFKKKSFDHSYYKIKLIIWKKLRPKNNVLEGYRESNILTRFTEES